MASTAQIAHDSTEDKRWYESSEAYVVPCHGSERFPRTGKRMRYGDRDDANVDHAKTDPENGEVWVAGNSSRRRLGEERIGSGGNRDDATNDDDRHNYLVKKTRAWPPV